MKDELRNKFLDIVTHRRPDIRKDTLREGGSR